MSHVIAIVGMAGSGKSIVSDYLVKKGYQKIYFGGVTLNRLKAKNLPITIENEKIMRESLRKEYGMGAYAIILLPQIKDLAKSGNVILDGLYSWDELKILQEEFKDNLLVIAVVVDKKIRYQRLRQREVRPCNLEEAISRDLAEIENLAKAGPIAYADYYINNNYNKEDLYIQIDKILNEIK